jgi:hypothetical protein
MSRHCRQNGVRHLFSFLLPRPTLPADLKDWSLIPARRGPAPFEKLMQLSQCDFESPPYKSKFVIST